MNLSSFVLTPEALAALLPHVNKLAVVGAAQMGAIMPFIVSILSQPRFSSRARTILSIVSCLIAAALVCISSNVFSGLNWAASTVVMLAISWGLFEHFYKPLGWTPWVEKVTEVSRYFPALVGLFGSSASVALQTAQRATDAAVVVPVVVSVVAAIDTPPESENIARP